MLCEHVVKVSRLGKFLFIGKGTMVSRFVYLSMWCSRSFYCLYGLNHIFANDSPDSFYCWTANL